MVFEFFLFFFEEERRRRHWEAAGGRPYLVTHVGPATWLRGEAPGGMDRDAAVAWASNALVRKSHRFGGCLVLGPAEAVWFREDGSSFVSNSGFTPHSRVRGRAFVLENLAGKNEPRRSP